MKNGRIDKYLFGGGYAQASVASSTTDNFAFYYYNQDHLGNIREVVNASGSVQQVTNYYPFGAPYADAAGSTNPDFQPYKYNGKELDKMHGLNTYDYGARQHDPILARWDRIDPLCEKHYNTSPYAYCGNSPINAIDPDGMDWYKDKDGSIQYNSGVHSQDDLSKGQTYLWVAKNDKKACSINSSKLLSLQTNISYHEHILAIALPEIKGSRLGIKRLESEGKIAIVNVVAIF